MSPISLLPKRLSLPPGFDEAGKMQVLSLQASKDVSLLQSPVPVPVSSQGRYRLSTALYLVTPAGSKISRPWLSSRLLKSGSAYFATPLLTYLVNSQDTEQTRF